jgi:rhamnose transport system permease protein
MCKQWCLRMNQHASVRLLHLGRYRRELAVTIAYVFLLVLAAVIAPSFFSVANWRDLVVNNAPVLVLAVGMTMIILVAEIDISVGSQFAVCSLVAAWLARAGMPMVLLAPCLLGVGALLGGLNGFLVARFKLPSIIVTLAMLAIWRNASQWVTQGAWVQDLPENFQWFGLGQWTGEAVIVATSLAVVMVFSWGLRSMGAGRAVHAVGSDAEAARLVGIDPARVVLSVFVLMGVLTSLAAVLNAVRFSAVPGNAGVGLELKVIAAVVVGGTAIRGGRGTLFGTFIGVALLGAIGTVLTFAGINPFWEKAIQGAIILSAAVSDAALGKLNRYVGFNFFRAHATQD